MKVVYGYKRDGEEKPILIKNCKFEYDRVKGRLVLANYDITAKFKEAEAMEADGPYALAIECDQRKRFIRFAEKKQVYPMKMGLYVDRDGVEMDVREGEATMHVHLTSDIGRALRLDDEALGEWKGFKMISKTIYAEERK